MSHSHHILCVIRCFNHGAYLWSVCKLPHGSDALARHQEQCFDISVWNLVGAGAPPPLIYCFSFCSCTTILQVIFVHIWMGQMVLVVIALHMLCMWRVFDNEAAFPQDILQVPMWFPTNSGCDEGHDGSDTNERDCFEQFHLDNKPNSDNFTIQMATVTASSLFVLTGFFARYSVFSQSQVSLFFFIVFFFFFFFFFSFLNTQYILLSFVCLYRFDERITSCSTICIISSSLSSSSRFYMLLPLGITCLGGWYCGGSTVHCAR